ncbi:unnamed protein product [Ranitomeya imitator]|uniref:Tetraspanin n=1 Tax=Ranitomeya imitator TaxID=111125 RepID=A0ABN9LJ39_9NEOB|nr:unnamed protein product [Ranitomeya imitator]
MDAAAAVAPTSPITQYDWPRPAPSHYEDSYQPSNQYDGPHHSPNQYDWPYPAPPLTIMAPTIPTIHYYCLHQLHSVLWLSSASLLTNLVIAIGTIVMVTGFLGCLGAIKENKCLLLSFFIILLIILLAELILLILFFVYMDRVDENAKQDLKDGLLLYNTENNVGLKNAWNIIQAEMHCCGVTDYTDWYPVLGENTVPDRCCMENSQDCGHNSTSLVWKTGCYEKVKMWFVDNKLVLGTIGMCVLIIQVCKLIFIISSNTVKGIRTSCMVD